MQLHNHSSAHLTYCLNVHPGETLGDVFAAIRGHAVPIRELVAPGQRFGLGLRIAGAASQELEAADRMAELQALLAEQNLYAFTINGFPFGTFHGARVKEQVYHPDWRTDERREYTCRLARQLAALLPAGLTGSISTVPGSYKAWIRSAGDVAAMAGQLAAAAAFLSRLHRETGREIHLGLEPEPDCFLETTAEATAFFCEQLLPQGRARVAGLLGCTPTAAEAIIRRHIGICFDTCHLALQFEDLVASLRQLADAGIRISKMQISAALAARGDLAAAEALRPFCDPVYLHQVKARAGGRVVSRGDLADALAALPELAVEEWRVHFHVPLYFVPDGLLASTADQLTPAFFRAAAELGVEHFEIETYTFDVLPEILRRRGVDRSVADEYGWVLFRFPKV
ncbi:MAG: metabolite traffic protein EboE [bacterium]